MSPLLPMLVITGRKRLTRWAVRSLYRLTGTDLDQDPGTVSAVVRRWRRSIGQWRGPSKPLAEQRVDDVPRAVTAVDREGP
jgi:hypothetical protein